jgi:SAM-dependent methyltransferase
MVDHNAQAGPLDRCQVCGSDNLAEIIDLGHQPPCAALLSKEQLRQPEVGYPLRLNQCLDCTLAQLDYVVPGHKIYPIDYPYIAGISWPVVEAHRKMAEHICTRFRPSSVLDIGSNDGTLLAQFKALGCSVLGVEPTGVGYIAEKAGIPTAHACFDERIAAEFGAFDVITMTNVFAHMAELGSVMRGVCKALNKDGVLVIENHYLLDVLERNQFDTVYHEHIRTYTLQSLRTLFSMYGLEIFDAARVPRYGGNIRVFVGWRGRHGVSDAVYDLTKLEAETDWAALIRNFRHGVALAKEVFLAYTHKRQSVGCSAPGRASTLLNYFGATTSHLSYTGEIDGSLKIGKYIPGCHIPIVSNIRLLEDEPESIVLLAWHYAEEIATRLRKEGVRSKLVAPLPFFREV